MRYFLIMIVFSVSVIAESYESLLKQVQSGKNVTLKLLHKAIDDNRLEEARAALFNYQKTVKKLGKVDDAYAIAGGRRYLQLLNNLKTKVSPEISKWIIGTPDRLHEFLSLISSDDDLDKVFEIITKLWNADPEKRDDFYSLILAFAVVWDTERPLIHNYMGKKPPKYEKNLVGRYEFLRNIYSRKSPMPYKYLSSRMLIYVVDLPISINEMKWAVENERGSAAGWGQKFNDVKYDKPRFDRNAFSWQHGDYTFAALLKKGGICIDQAYYTAMTARCWGIPSMIFTGKGRRGGHAWMGIMKSPNKWTKW